MYLHNGTDDSLCFSSTSAVSVLEGDGGGDGGDVPEGAKNTSLSLTSIFLSLFFDLFTYSFIFFVLFCQQMKTS